MSYKMYVNITRGACLLRLQRHLFLKSMVLWSGLVSRVGASHRVNLIALLIFVSLAWARLLQWYSVPRPQSPFGVLCLDHVLKRKFVKKVTLTEAIMVKISTGLLWKMSRMLLQQWRLVGEGGDGRVGTQQASHLCLWDSGKTLSKDKYNILWDFLRTFL